MGYAGSHRWLHWRLMRVFLSWSKEPSKSIATFLRGWLTDVIQSLDPWMSGEDIPVGDRWANQISGELESRNYGILILTPENQFQPWINYEAGALSKLVGSSRVIPYTFGFKPADVSSPPLTAFQGVEATEEGTWRMLVEINKGLAVPLAELQLRRAFEKNWGDLDTELKRIAEEEAKRGKANPGTTPPPRSDSDKLDEMLVMLRNLSLGTSERSMMSLDRKRKIKTEEQADEYRAMLSSIMSEYKDIAGYEVRFSENKWRVEIFIDDTSLINSSVSDIARTVSSIIPNVEIHIPRYNPR